MNIKSCFRSYGAILAIFFAIHVMCILAFGTYEWITGGQNFELRVSIPLLMIFLWSGAGNLLLNFFYIFGQLSTLKADWPFGVMIILTFFVFLPLASRLWPNRKYKAVGLLVLWHVFAGAGLETPLNLSWIH